MEGFRALLLEGVFYNEGPRFLCAGARGVEGVSSVLSSVEGQRVRFAAHHLPPTAQPDLSKWGGGCCLWQPSGRCPAGHAEKPSWLFNISLEGVLLRVGDAWFVEGFDGKTTALTLQEMLIGHHARIATATLLDVEKMREAVESKNMTGTVDDLVARADDLRDLLSRIRSGGR